MTAFPTLENTLKEHQLNITAARQAVFQALHDAEPLTMAELVARCKSINRASVYRTVSLFEQLGIIQRLQNGWKYKLELSDTFHDHHHHITCLVCGQTEVIAESKTIENQLDSLAFSAGFQLSRHQLELQGYCQGCQDLLKD